MKMVSLIPYGEFIFIQLDKNTTKPVKIRVYIHVPIERDFIMCLKANVDLFAHFQDEMLDINPSVTYH